MFVYECDVQRCLVSVCEQGNRQRLFSDQQSSLLETIPGILEAR